MEVDVRGEKKDWGKGDDSWEGIFMVDGTWNMEHGGWRVGALYRQYGGSQKAPRSPGSPRKLLCCFAALYYFAALYCFAALCMLYCFTALCILCSFAST
jgi:hypothetical protein